MGGREVEEKRVFYWVLKIINSLSSRISEEDNFQRLTFCPRLHSVSQNALVISSEAGPREHCQVR